MTINTTVLPQTLGILHNDARVSSDTFDGNNANDLSHTDTNVQTSADLAVTNVSSPATVVAGRALNFRVTVANNGPSTARNVTLNDPLPAGVTFNAVTVSNNSGTCNDVAGPPDTV